MGEYLKEIHACNPPEFDLGHGEGTVWQCECERIYIQTWHVGVYVPSGYHWKRVLPQYWDAETLTEKPVTWELPEQPKKKWWKK
jgi:hypothetical protein